MAADRLNGNQLQVVESLCRIRDHLSSPPVPVKDWPVVDGYVCRFCCQPARECPTEPRKWACLNCGKEYWTDQTRNDHPFVNAPVIQDEDGWFFWAETSRIHDSVEMEPVGPYATREEAIQAMQDRVVAKERAKEAATIKPFKVGR